MGMYESIMALSIYYPSLLLLPFFYSFIDMWLYEKYNKHYILLDSFIMILGGDTLKRIKLPKWRPRTIIGFIVGLSFLFSIIFVIIKLFIAPNIPDVATPFVKLRSDYVLMLMQCMLGLLLIFFPYLLERKWKLFFPDMMYILFFIFLFCAIFLGEVRSFYYNVPHWDSYLHAISAAMLATVGFNIINLLNDAKIVRIDLSPFFVAFFAFCFSLACGTCWEIYEFTFDGIFSLNMQKYNLQDGTPLIGRAALYDTMKDIIVDALSTLAICILGYIQLHVTVQTKKKKEHKPQ